MEKFKKIDSFRKETEIDIDKKSILAPRWDELLKTKEGFYIDSEGRRWFELSSDPEKQYFISKISKGVISVADIVFVENGQGGDGIFLSRVFKEEDLKEKESKMALVDIYILEYVFGDFDHSLDGQDNLFIKKMTAGEKYYYYDFDRATLKSPLEELSFLAEYTTDDLMNKKNILLEKTQHLKKNLEDDVFLESFVKTLSKDRREHFRKYALSLKEKILKNIKILENKLS